MPQFSTCLLAFSTDKISERFWRKVERNAHGCWEWQGARDRYGYGIFKLAEGARITASRFAFVLSRGVEPGSRQVCHTCDHPACCNPEHLTLGDAKSNALEKVRRGRARGRFSKKVQSVAPAHVCDEEG